MRDIVKVKTEKSDRPVKMYTKEKIDKLLEGKENDIDESIYNANIVKSDLDTSISTANITNTNLDSSISTADTAKMNLNDVVATANSTKNSLDQSISNGDFLSKTNTTSYTPIADYNPATKKYIDDSISNAGGGDMLKTIYDSNSDGKVDLADIADSVEWNGIKNKPLTFSPSTHNHDSDYAPKNHNHNGTYEPTLPSKTGNAGKVLAVNNVEDRVQWVAQTENAVDSVNGEIGTVVLKTDDITDTPSNRYVSDSEKSIWNNKADQSNTYTKQETDNKIYEVVGTAPQGLDTLEEIAESLNNDKDFAGTMTTQLAEKVDKVLGKQLSAEDYSTAEKNKLAGIEANANKYVHPSTHSASLIVQDAENRFVTDTDKTNWNNASADKHTHTNKTVLDGVTQALVDGWNGAVAHLSDAVKHITSSERTLWNTVSNKVDKVTGKQLSTENYSTEEKNKLAGIETGANKYVHPNTHSVDAITESSTKKIMTDAERTKLANVEAGAEVNNISDVNAADLTDGGNSTLHYHSGDRKRTNHTGTQLASTISDFTSAVRGTILTGLSAANNVIITATDTVLSALGKLQKQVSDNLATLSNHISNKSNPHSVTKSQLGLGNVDNTSDINKPISSASQIAFNDKLGKTEKAVDSDKLDGRDSSQFQHRQVHDFYVEGDADIYYPVVIQSLYSPVDMISNVQIYRNYSWNAPETWNTATHKGGLCLDMNMNLYGWGGHNYTSDVMLSQQYSKMVADIRVPLPDTDSIIVWLRGGHALYRCFANINQPVTVTVYLDQYINKKDTQYEHTYYPTTTIIPELNKIGVLRFSSEADYIIGTGYRDVIGGKKVALRDSNNDLITNSNISFSNNDGFCYDDTQNKMYLKRDGINCELYHEGNFDPNSKSDITHNHNTAYEPKNTNIQTHIASEHAPSNAQKNSDIAKAEIEGKLTGTITSHNHNPDHTHSNKTVIDKLSMSGTESNFDLSNLVTTDELNAAEYGDMDKSVYDTNNNGKVDISENAEKFGGNSPSYYATAHSHPYLALAGGEVTGNLSMTKTNGRFTFNETALSTGNSGLEFKTSTNQNCTILHEISDNELPLPGQALIINGGGTNTHIATDGEFFALTDKKAWHEGNFNPATKLNSSGGTVTGNLNIQGDLNLSSNNIIRGSETNDYIKFNPSTDGVEIYANNAKTLEVSGNTLKYEGNNIWHAGNDGSGSGLDADKLRGLTPSTSNVANTITQRNSSGDIRCRLLRSEYTGTTATPNYFLVQHATGTGDNYARPCTAAQVKNFLGISKITKSTSDPSGGSDGDIWIKYDA